MRLANPNRRACDFVTAGHLENLTVADPDFESVVRSFFDELWPLSWYKEHDAPRGTEVVPKYGYAEFIDAISSVNRRDYKEIAAALLKLGYRHHDGDGVPADKEEAWYWFVRASGFGVAEAHLMLGKIYSQQWKGNANAAKQYRLAAKQGNVEAQELLGIVRKIVKLERKSRAEYFRLQRRINMRMAEKGNPQAQSWLGYEYHYGLGVTKDLTKAAKWYRLAAEQGCEWGQSGLGDMYESGQGLPKDVVEAAKWYRLAAEQWDLRAQCRLALMLHKGEGTPKDDVLAYMWARLSYCMGYPPADGLCDMIAANMAFEQITEAKRLADNRMPWRQGDRISQFFTKGTKRT